MSYPPSGGNYDTLPVGAELTTTKSRATRPLRGLLRPRAPSTRSLLDEIIPTPTSDGDRGNNGSLYYLARRTGSVAVISIFLLSIIFLASTEGTLKSAGSNLRSVFGSNSMDVGNADAAWLLGEDEGQVLRPHPAPDFEKYTMLRTIEPSDYKLSKGHRLIFIGDIHGSYDPLERLMSKISYDQSRDVLIHVGDLIAKGDKNEEVLQWMMKHKIQGVRGNHDQPVLQWRAWMEWAGGKNWESFVDHLGQGKERETIEWLKREKKMFPADWEWKGEHWNIARYLSESSYNYLLDLPLVLHFPALHTFVVHAGLLPHDPLKALSEPSQPLFAADTTLNATLSRSSEEISILRDIPQNTVPWNLINMRSIRTKGKRKGEPTKSSKKGKPWSKVWNKQMARCTGPGAWASWADLVSETWEDIEGDEDQEDEVERRDDTSDEEGDDNVEMDKLKCSPVSVIYGHAAGRGLDIKPFSKGIDTGCVYGKKLTVLILGDHQVKGKSVRVGDESGVLVSESCKGGGK